MKYHMHSKTPFKNERETETLGVDTAWGHDRDQSSQRDLRFPKQRRGARETKVCSMRGRPGQGHAARGGEASDDCSDNKNYYHYYKV